MNRRTFISTAAAVGFETRRARAAQRAHPESPAEASSTASARRTGPIELDLQTRDPDSNRIFSNKRSLDPARTGIVIIDMWNYHWCMTAAQRVAALVPRMNAALAAARQLGMQVIWAPTDVASQYVGTPQRERSIALPHFSRPAPAEFVCRLTAKQGKCLCGPGIPCLANYGWDAMNPDLRIDSNDVISSGTDELYGNCRTRNLDHLIYMGVHTNVCVMGKPEAIRNMASAGLNCILARDLTDAITHYDPEAAYTPEDGTAQTVADIERAGIPTINMAGEMRKSGVWDENAVVEMVRISPWGARQRPYQFHDAVTVTLTSPWLGDVDIRYTTDGSEPGPASARYAKPLRLTGTTVLRTVALRQGRRVSLPSQSLFVRLAPLPPAPDVYLDEPKRPMSSPPDLTWQPKVDQSFHGGPLRVRGHTYAKGMGMRAPSDLLYEVQPEYERFVGLAGVDDDPFREQPPMARFLAMHASVQFRIYIDGNAVTESPVMRISQEPWRFDLRIPKGSRLINLVVTDAGSRSAYDLADWVDAGFVLARSHSGHDGGPC
jgi:nicotinamidase-related amidase